MFQIQDISNRGNRGRPPAPRKVSSKREVVLSAKGMELGELSMEAEKNGSVILTAVVNGRKRTIEFPAPAPSRGRPRKATVKASTARRKVTKATPKVRKRKGVQAFA